MFIQGRECSFSGSLEDFWSSAAKGIQICLNIYIYTHTLPVSLLLVETNHDKNKWRKWKIMSAELSAASNNRFRFVLSKGTWVLPLR